jgi:hypothetical protein
MYWLLLFCKIWLALCVVSIPILWREFRDAPELPWHD